MSDAHGTQRFAHRFDVSVKHSSLKNSGDRIDHDTITFKSFFSTLDIKWQQANFILLPSLLWG